MKLIFLKIGIVCAAVLYLATSEAATVAQDAHAQAVLTAPEPIKALSKPADKDKDNTRKTPPPPPWYTGPLLAPAGHTIPAGHINLEPYLFATNDIGTYNSSGHLERRAGKKVINPTMIITQGVLPRMDIQYSLPYNFNYNKGEYGSGPGDIGVILGFQALNDKPHTVIPDLRVTLEEVLPSGNYNDLNANAEGTDANGAGSFQTAVGLNFQKLTHFYDEHFLRTRLSLTYTVPSHVSVRNHNAYGGGNGTDGTVKPGQKFSTDLAFEYTLTRHIVPVFEVLYTMNGRTRFSGTPGRNSTGMAAVNTSPSGNETSLAPALEYNFNEHLGIIAGAWFSIAGRNNEDFESAVVALNYYY